MDIGQWREVFLVVSRKNGKSIFAAAVSAYMAYLDGEYGARIYDMAPKLEQAAIVYDATYNMIQQEPELSALAVKRRSDIYLEGTNTTIRPLAFNAKKSDGFNRSLWSATRLPAGRREQGLKQYEVMKSALGARRQPLILSISTSGYINDGPYDELMKRATAWLLGSSKERRLLRSCTSSTTSKNGTTSMSCEKAIRTWVCPCLRISSGKRLPLRRAA